VNKKIQMSALGALVVCLVLILSGCETSTKQISSVDSKLVGTWQGSIALSSFSGRGNSTLTQITFMGSTAALTTMNDLGTRTMNYTYTTSAGSLVLTPQYRQGVGPRQFNGTQPPGNWSWPGNGTRPPYNGTWPNGTSPGNWSGWQNRSGQNNRTQPGTRVSMEMTFTYRFDETGSLLYLNNAMFTRAS
jgi:hypothetical protein